jgi:hypothetical protein
LKRNRRGRRGLLAIGAATAVAAAAPAAASALTITVTGDDGNPVALSGALNIRNMNPQLAINATASEHWGVSVTGPTGGLVSSDTGCTSGTESGKYIDYIGNGPYTVHLSTYNATCSSHTTQDIPFTITASTAITPPPVAALTRKPGSTIPNTVTLPIDLNPGALSTDAFVERNVAPNPDGSLPGTPEQLFPDPATRTVAIRLDKGPGVYVVAAHAKGYTGVLNPQAFSPWATPVAIRTFAPFDLQRFTWTDSTGPSYRFSATVRATGASGRVSVSIKRGKSSKSKTVCGKPSYKSLGSLKIRKHKFSKRIRLTRLGTYNLCFKYKGNSTVAGGYEIHKFQITRRVIFRGAVARGASFGG